MNLVYKYGLLAPTLNAPKVRDLLHAAHRYRNTLTEIEKGRRAAIRAIELEVGLGPNLDPNTGEVLDLGKLATHALAEEAVLAAAHAIKAHRSKLRTNKVPQDLKDALTGAKKVRSETNAAVREARRQLREDAAACLQLDEINALAADLRRNARAYSGLARLGPHFGSWGTYQLIEKAAEMAGKDTPLYDPRSFEPSDPHYSRFTGEGAVGVQINGGLTPTELLTHSQIQILPRARETSQSPRRNPANIGKASPTSRRGQQAATLRLRVGSSDSGGSEPVWVEWPMILHRPLPEDARIMAAAVHVHKVATSEIWDVTITIRTQGARAPAKRAGAVAVNFGWRRVPEGVRVGAWVGEDGGRGEIVVSNSTLARLRHASSIRSLRDELFDLARPWTLSILDALDAASSTPVVPEWLRKETKTLLAWKSQERFTSLVHRWSRNRFPGDEAAFAAVDAWRRRERHLWQYEAGERRGALAHRLDTFRCAAAKLAARYDTLVIDGFDFSMMKTCPMLEAPSESAAFGEDNERARSNMHASAPGYLRSAIVSAFRGDVETVSSIDLTHLCPACGSLETFDAAIKIYHRCEACGTEWDQDHAAAENMLGRPRTLKNPPTPHGDTSVPDPAETPRAKSRRMAKERAARLAAARNADDKAAE